MMEIGEIKKDKELLQRMSTKIKRKLSDIDITFKKIHIEGQYGETNY
jgi:RNA polymerase-binding transcription factor DksA